MKKLVFIFLFFAFGSAKGFAQKPVVFYGVDFSLAKVRGTSETVGEFTAAFEKINDLFYSESEKYDIGKYTRHTVTKQNIAIAKRAIRAALADNDTAESTDNNPLLTGDPAYDCRAEIDGKVAGYELPETEGLGLIVIANLLDKQNGKGSFYFVTFDIASRKIEGCIRTDGKPGGFGLRNFWANALYQSMKACYKLK